MTELRVLELRDVALPGIDEHLKQEEQNSSGEEIKSEREKQ